ncbi:MAG: recombinase family protein [Clostridia bacterium]|nr:recombinase family protein [Clostridia bacterium]
MKQRCYIYTRVSTSMQVEGFSLDAQRTRLLKFAEFRELEVVGEYSDKGRSGKNIQGRPEFQRMLKDIESGKDKVSFVLVFKLSRFGRNAADVLTSLQKLQDNGVNLICAEDGLDSSHGTGKLIIQILSAVAELERENIRVQTMEGRLQKAREGKWNGGFAPYGYKLVDGKLEIAEDEVEVIRIIFDKFVNTTIGINGIAKYLNDNGFNKKKRQNNTLDYYVPSFIKKVLDNPVYCGKIAFQRRKTEKIAGKHEEYHIVSQTDFPVYDGVHEAIVSEEIWLQAQKKRKKTGHKRDKKHKLEHEHLLSGIIKCPVCDANLYGNVNRKKKDDGTYYKDYYFYACKHRKQVNGVRCNYDRQWNQETVNKAVEETIRKVVNNPDFEAALRKKIDSRVDTSALDAEMENLQKALRQLISAKDRLGQQMDTLDVTDKHYDKKYEDMQARLDDFYDKIDAAQEEIAELQARIDFLVAQKISSDNVYKYLLYFDKLYDKFTDKEKKTFLGSFVEKIEIYPTETPNGRILKRIQFRFPLFYEGEEIIGLSWDNETTLECAVQLTRQKNE